MRSPTNRAHREKKKNAILIGPTNLVDTIRLRRGCVKRCKGDDKTWFEDIATTFRRHFALVTEAECRKYARDPLSTHFFQLSVSDGRQCVERICEQNSAHIVKSRFVRRRRLGSLRHNLYALLPWRVDFWFRFK